MNISNLAQHVKDGDVQELNLVALEGGSYVLHAVREGRSIPVQNANGVTLHVASVEEARKVLTSVPEAVKLFLVQFQAHDEMVGLDDQKPETARHEVPLRSSL